MKSNVWWVQQILIMSYVKPCVSFLTIMGVTIIDTSFWLLGYYHGLLVGFLLSHVITRVIFLKLAPNSIIHMFESFPRSFRFLVTIFPSYVFRAHLCYSIYRHCIIKSFLVHTYILLVDSHLGCFCFCSIMNNSAVNIINVQVLVWLCIFMFHEYIFRNYWTMWYMFLKDWNFFKNCQTVFQSLRAFPQECAVFSHLLQTRHSFVCSHPGADHVHLQLPDSP